MTRLLVAAALLTSLQVLRASRIAAPLEATGDLAPRRLEDVTAPPSMPPSALLAVDAVGAADARGGRPLARALAARLFARRGLPRAAGAVAAPPSARPIGTARGKSPASGHRPGHAESPGDPRRKGLAWIAARGQSRTPLRRPGNVGEAGGGRPNLGARRLDIAEPVDSSGTAKDVGRVGFASHPLKDPEVEERLSSLQVTLKDGSATAAECVEISRQVAKLAQVSVARFVGKEAALDEWIDVKLEAIEHFPGHILARSSGLTGHMRDIDAQRLARSAVFSLETLYKQLRAREAFMEVRGYIEGRGHRMSGHIWVNLERNLMRTMSHSSLSPQAWQSFSELLSAVDRDRAAGGRAKLAHWSRLLFDVDASLTALDNW